MMKEGPWTKLGVMIAIGSLIVTMIALQGDDEGSGISLMIYNRLGSGQISEQVLVYIDGEFVGTLNVDSYHPVSMMKFAVPKAGKYDYEVRTSTVYANPPRRLQMEGKGTINVEACDNIFILVITSGVTIKLRRIGKSKALNQKNPKINSLD